MSNRPNLTVDQQFFQELLSAAFTIQEHNDRLNQTSPAPAITTAPEPQPVYICLQCGAQKPNEQAPCQRCGGGDFRAGERMQRKWASMWLMSQQQGLWPERSSTTEEGTTRDASSLDLKRPARDTSARDFAGSGILSLPFDIPMEHEAPRNKDKAKDKKDTVHRGNGNGANGNGANGNQGNGDHEGNRANRRSAKRVVPDKFEFKTEFPVSNWTMEAPEVHPAGDRYEEDRYERDLRDEALPEEDPLQQELRNDALPHELALEDFDRAAPAFHSSGQNDDDLALDDAGSLDVDLSEADDTRSEDETTHIPILQRIATWRVKLRFHRADVYLGTAVLVAGIALLWPVAGSSRQSSLSPWERALVTLGIAEAPAPVIHVQGDPAIEVWVDPHSALYYCPGEEQYGKTPDGRFTSQREAQMDRFEPDGRSACE